MCDLVYMCSSRSAGEMTRRSFSLYIITLPVVASGRLRVRVANAQRVSSFNLEFSTTASCVHALPFVQRDLIHKCVFMSSYQSK